jgi:hypothetical protein
MSRSAARSDAMRMVIRHTEKQDDAGVIAGVTIEGRPDSEDLTIRGWQRAGALVGLFLHPMARSSIEVSPPQRRFSLQGMGLTARVNGLKYRRFLSR